MGARELDQSAVWGIEALQGDALHARLRAFERYKEQLRTRESSKLAVQGKPVLAAQAPSLLDQYRKNPLAVRERIERDARRARAQMVGDWLSRILA